jgi:hypothetical protein
MSETPGTIGSDRDSDFDGVPAQLPDEAPEADAIDQARDTLARETAAPVPAGDELVAGADEADLQEQSVVVELDEEETR